MSWCSLVGGFPALQSSLFGAPSKEVGITVSIGCVLVKSLTTDILPETGHALPSAYREKETTSRGGTKSGVNRKIHTYLMGTTRKAEIADPAMADETFKYARACHTTDLELHNEMNSF